MAIKMQLWGSPHGPTEFDGEYLLDMDFEAHDGLGELTTTPDVAKAKWFADMADALEFWGRSPKCRPIRPDGKPNRPLTATNWEFFPCD